MANLRQLGGRLKAARSIRTITKALEMASTARVRRLRAVDAGAEPAAAWVDRALTGVVAAAGAEAHPLLHKGAGDVRGLVVLASDRGMCGGYNQRVTAAAVEAAEQLTRPEGRARFYVVGKKGISELHHRLSGASGEAALPDDRLAPPHVTSPAFAHSRLYDAVCALGEELCGEFAAGALASVHVTYMRRLSRGVGLSMAVAPAVAQILPVAVPADPAPAEDKEYDFYPSAADVLARLLPLAAMVRLYACFIEAALGEQMARLTAMATANANAIDMTRQLDRQIRRARQGRITAELTDITGGAEALKGTW